MGRYLIKQHVFTLRDKFTIKDAAGNDRFLVTGKLISIGKKFSVCAMTGMEIYKIRQKIFHLFPRFQILTPSGQLAATYKTKFSLFRKKAVVESPYGKLILRGGVLAWDFNLTGNGGVLMSISKKILRIADTYTVDVNGGDEALMLSVAIIVDAIYHRHR
jgi:uncharacterized protein YxjI